MGNHHDDEDSDDSNAVRANGLHDLHCDLISAPFPVQVNNEGKGRKGEKKRAKKRKKENPNHRTPKRLPIYAFLRRTMHKTQRATEPLQDAGLLKRMHSFYYPSFLPFTLLCFAFLSFLCAPTSRPLGKQASKQASRAYAMQTYTYAPISPRISTMISPRLLAVGLQQKDFLAFVSGDDDDDDDKRKDERETKPKHTNATPSSQHSLA